jgi:hypothetical protein
MTTLTRQEAILQPVPITQHRLRWQEALSAVIAGLMAFASLGGLFIHGLYWDNTWSTAAYRGTDLATLLIAVPLLAAAVLLAHRGSDRARLVWLGVLAYNIYNYAFYLFGAAFNDFFLLYAALEALSLIALIGTAPAVLAVHRTITSIRRRLVAGYMAVVGIMFAAMWVSQAVKFITAGTLPKLITDAGIHTSIVFALDLTLIVPAFLLGAVLLWCGHPAGLVLGASINVLGVIYMAALAFAGGFQANAGISGVSWAAFPYIELAVTSIIATVLLLWRYATAGSPASGRPPSPRGQVKEGFADEAR